VFDRYITVDWSASSTPKVGEESVWVASLQQGGQPWTANPSTRGAARTILRRLLVDAVQAEERVLVGFDFPYAYPAGFAAALGLPDPHWRSTWEHLSRRLVDDPLTNKNNRFALGSELNAELGHHEFWGHPVGRSFEHLLPTKSGRIDPPMIGLPEFRETELRTRRPGSSPKSVWQLYGNGSVGSQSLTGIPVLAGLRFDSELKALSIVWPFETVQPNLPVGRRAIVYAEIWPGLLSIVKVEGQVKDKTQVISLALEFQELDRRDRLETLFAATPGANDTMRNCYAPMTVKTTAGAVTLQRPKLRGTTERFASRLFGEGVTHTNALGPLVTAGFVRACRCVTSKPPWPTL